MTSASSGDEAPCGPEPDLRAITYLAPGVPLRFFELVTEYLGRELGCAVSLTSETLTSGPMYGAHDPFAAGEVDFGFLCSPSFLSLRSQPEPSVDLVPAAFVMDDPRHGSDEPVYYSDVVVRAEHPAQSLDDLADATWGYNDDCSLSGYFAVLQHAQESGNETFFQKRVRTGSHDASVRAVLDGEIDAAAIDSTSLMFQRRHDQEFAGKMRVVTSFGPFPIQPIVVRRTTAPGLGESIATSLLKLQCADTIGEDLCEFGLRKFVAIDEQAYEEERRQLCALGELDARKP